MTQLRVVHRTLFTYSEEIVDTAMEMRLRPIDDAGQRVLAYELRVDPWGPLRSYRDVFGNVVESYNHRAPHRTIVAEAGSTVETGPRPPERGVLPAGERFRFLRHDGPVLDLPAVREIAAHVGGEGRSADRALLASLTGYVNQTFAYVPNVTSVDSTVADLIEHGKGVCQDFAHLWIAVCRARGVPARYVSGYVWTGGTQLPEASHAWGEAWIDGEGWVGYDPTNWRAETAGAVAEQHVRVAVGRDYRDVPPTRGVYRGAASESLAVDVRVEKVEPGQVAERLPRLQAR